MITLTLTETRVSYRNQGSIGVDYVDAAIANSKNRIGEQKQIRMRFTASKSVIGFDFYINPALFANVGAPIPFAGTAGTRYYYTRITATSFLFTANYNALGALFPNIDKIESVEVIANTTTQVDVYINFFQSYDYEGFLEPNLGDNHSHLLKDKKSSTAELTVSGSSVYSSTGVDFRTYIYLENPSVPTDNGWIDVNPKYGYKAGFYNEGTHGVATFWKNPVFILSRSPYGPVTDLSAVQDTTLGFTVETRTPASIANQVDFFFAKIIRADKFDNTVDFISNYDLEQAYVDPSTPATPKLKNFVASYLSGINKFSCAFDVDYTGVNLGEKYRIIVYAYNNQFPTTYEVDVFISDELTVTADSPYTGNGFDVSARLRDLFHSYTGNYLQCCIEERIRSTITLDYMDDYGINMYFRDIYNRLGLTISDVSRYLTQIDFTIYDIASTPGQKHVVDQRTAWKFAPGSYFQPFFSVAFGTGNIVFEADWRNRYEAGIPNIQTYDTTTGAALGQLSNQYWGGRSFWIEWKLTFIYDDYVTPFTDEVLIQQEMIVRDYSTCVNIYAQNPPDETKEFWCPEDLMCLRSEFNPACLGGSAPANFYLIVNIEPDPGTITTIQENEMFVPLILPQLTTPLISSQEIPYSNTLANNAKFCVDVPGLLFTDYKITAFAKRT